MHMQSGGCNEKYQEEICILWLLHCCMEICHTKCAIQATLETYDQVDWVWRKPEP